MIKTVPMPSLNPFKACFEVARSHCASGRKPCAIICQKIFANRGTTTERTFALYSVFSKLCHRACRRHFHVIFGKIVIGIVNKTAYYLSVSTLILIRRHESRIKKPTNFRDTRVLRVTKSVLLNKL